MVFVINKLYRDLLVEQQTARGRKVLCTRKTAKELIELLYEKGEEEIAELTHLAQILQQDTEAKLHELQKQIIKEMKDIQEVIDVLTDMWEKTEKLSSFVHIIETVKEQYSIDTVELVSAQQKDREERGSFREWRYVYKQEIPRDTQENINWHDYFAKKYPQEKSF